MTSILSCFRNRPGMTDCTSSRQELIAEAQKTMRDAKLHSDLAEFNRVVERIAEHRLFEEERIRWYKCFWKWVILLVPILALLATVGSTAIFAVDYASFKNSPDWGGPWPIPLKVAAGVAFLEFVVAVASGLIAAKLPAQNYTKACSNAIRLEDLLFRVASDAMNFQLGLTCGAIENSGTSASIPGAPSKRAGHWKKVHEQISLIGQEMILEDVSQHHA